MDIAVAAHAKAAADGIDNATDDVQLALRIGHRAVIVDGGPHNIKITHPPDLEIARLLLERKLGRSKVVRLTRPFSFDEREVLCTPDITRIAVRPLLGAICAADLRYYAGKRPADALPTGGAFDKRRRGKSGESRRRRYRDSRPGSSIFR